MCHEPRARRPGSRARWWYHHDVASIVDLTDPAAVQTALNEYDQVGADAFLAKYGFGPARSYFVVRDGKRYDSKAIVGVAYGYQHPAEGRGCGRGYIRSRFLHRSLRIISSSLAI